MPNPPKNKKQVRNIDMIVDNFRKQDSEVKLDDFRDLAIKIPSNINAEVFEDKNGFLFDANTGRVYALNRTASCIYSKIQKGLSLSEIVHQLLESFDVTESMAVSDLQDFLYQLREFGIGVTE